MSSTILYKPLIFLIIIIIIIIICWVSSHYYSILATNPRIARDNYFYGGFIKIFFFFTI